MSNIEILKELKERGLLKPLVQAGVVPVKVVTQMDIYYMHDAQIQSGVKPDKAVRHLATSFGVCKKTIYNAINSMK